MRTTAKWAAPTAAATGSVCLGLALLACSAATSRDEGAATTTAQGFTTAALEQVTGFGSNPAGLSMFRYVPAGVGANAPVVVVLHGCTQHASDMVNAGFNALADVQKFHVVYPEQVTANNAALCFNWFDANNIKRGQGENLSIKQMVDKMKADFSVDAARVFVVGFSSGGAEAALMLATYPDVFSAGATFSGIPYDCAETVGASSACIKPGKDQTAKAWGDLVRAANPGYAGAWPRLSIWQGTADSIVDPSNTKELVRQWTNVNGLAETPSASDTVGGYPHDVYGAGAGRVETFAITGKDHGLFVDPAAGCGATASYFLDAKICGASHALHFFGIGPADPTDAGADGASSDAGLSADGGGGEGGSTEGGAKDGGADAGHDATPGTGGYGGGSSSGSTSSSSSSSSSGGAADAGGGFTAPPADGGGGLAGCSLGTTRPHGSLGFALGTLLGLAALRRRSGKTK